VGRAKAAHRKIAKKMRISPGRIPYILAYMEPGWPGGELPPAEEAFGRITWDWWQGSLG
jgi:hypothetical protein